MKCIVCQTEITTDRPGAAQTCSTLCRDEAYRQKRKRKLRRRMLDPEFRKRVSRRTAARERAKLHADPTWQAWRADVDRRKREKAERSEHYRKQLEEWRIARAQKQFKPRQLQCVCGKEFTQTNWKQVYCSMRCRWKQKHDVDRVVRSDYYPRERARRKRQRKEISTVVNELRTFGWIDEKLEFIVPDYPRIFPVLLNDDPPTSHPYALERERERLACIKSALPGQIVEVNRAGVARKLIVDKRLHQRSLVAEYEWQRKSGLSWRMATALRRERKRRQRDQRYSAIFGCIVIVNTAGRAKVVIVDRREYSIGYQSRYRAAEMRKRRKQEWWRTGMIAEREAAKKEKPQKQPRIKWNNRPENRERVRQYNRERWAKKRALISALDQIAPDLPAE